MRTSELGLSGGLAERIRAAGSRANEAALAQLPPTVENEGMVLEGDAAGMVAEASGEFDLILVGSRGYSPLRHVLLRWHDPYPLRYGLLPGAGAAPRRKRGAGGAARPARLVLGAQIDGRVDEGDRRHAAEDDAEPRTRELLPGLPVDPVVLAEHQAGRRSGEE